MRSHSEPATRYQVEGNFADICLSCGLDQAVSDFVAGKLCKLSMSPTSKDEVTESRPNPVGRDEDEKSPPSAVAEGIKQHDNNLVCCYCAIY